MAGGCLRHIPTPQVSRRGREGGRGGVGEGERDCDGVDAQRGLRLAPPMLPFPGLGFRVQGLAVSGAPMLTPPVFMNLPPVSIGGGSTNPRLRLGPPLHPGTSFNLALALALALALPLTRQWQCLSVLCLPRVCVCLSVCHFEGCSV